MKTFSLYKLNFRLRHLLIAAAVLLAVSFLTASLFWSTVSVGHQKLSLQNYIHQQQKDANKLLSNKALMYKLARSEQFNNLSNEEISTLTEKQYGFFIYEETLSESDVPVFWNTQKIVPLSPNFASADTVYFNRLENGYFVISKKRLILPGTSNNVVAYIIIPVYHEFEIESDDTRTRFAHDDNAIEKIAISNEPTDFSVVSLENQPLFYIKKAANQYGMNPDKVTIVLRLSAFLLFLIAVHFVARSILRVKGNVAGILFLGIMLLAIRVTLHYFPGLLSLRDFALFDPSTYASNFLNHSLGALLLNAIFLCWLVLFTWNHIGPLKNLPTFLQGKKIIVAGVAGVIVLVFATFSLARVVHNLVVNSKISFDVTDVSSLESSTGFSFLILALLSLSYYYFSRLLFRIVLQAFPNLFYLYIVVALTGLGVLTLQSNYSFVLFHLPVLLWLVAYTLILTQEQAIINRFRITIAGILFWVFLFSVSLAALIMSGNRSRELRELRGMAVKYEELHEPTKQQSLAIALAYLNNRFLNQNYYRFYNQDSSQFIRDSIAGTGLTSSSKKYNIEIYWFDSAKKGVNNPQNISYSELDNIYTQQSKLTDLPELMYYETSFSEFVYIFKNEVSDSTGLKGTLFLLAKPRNFLVTDVLHVDIFRKDEDEQKFAPAMMAVYKNGRLMQFLGSYAFPVTLNEKLIPTAQETMIEREKYNELWYKGSNKKVIIVASKKESFIESITLFSYLFCSFLFMIGTIRLFELAARISRTWPRVDIFSRLNIRSQIHFTIIFISILSFLIIGAASITYFYQRNEREEIDDLNRTASTTLREITKRMDTENLSYSVKNFPDSIPLVTLKNLLEDISDVHNLNVNIYDKEGNLLSSSAERIYTQGYLSKKMHPEAYYHLSGQNQVQRLQNELISDWEYRSIYMAIRDKNMEPYAYLHIPSFKSTDGLNQEISNFVVTIINLNAFIILISGVIALFITNRITGSFSVIGNKMKAITLGKNNEEIEWNKEDEIGELIKQYNKMVQQLEGSASALAKSEREGAWREMARQVAHEIKNPLTPMKLSIQYLQKSIQANQPNVKELTTNVANTLIEQIDHLSKIAADFSQFANIGTRRLEEIDLHNVIGSLLDLYATNPKVDVTWNPVLIAANMQADKTHMNRLFTNLLTNAVDACSERETCVVVLTEKLVGNNLQVAISDNGDGIPAEMQSRIFTPNFTTKTSGTGLGLAMCKGIIEQAGGQIWFETKEGEGTTFFVQLPLSENGMEEL